MHPVTISRRHAPVFLCSAISRIVSIDSCLALSMNAQVLTTSTSASAASRVRRWPFFWASPSITSESTRFLGQPSDTIPIFMRSRFQVLGCSVRVHVRRSVRCSGFAVRFEARTNLNTNLELRTEKREPQITLGYTYRHADRRSRRYIHASEGTDTSRDTRHRSRLGAHAPRLQGRLVVHSPARRLSLRSDSSRSARAIAQLRE